MLFGCEKLGVMKKQFQKQARASGVVQLVKPPSAGIPCKYGLRLSYPTSDLAAYYCAWKSTGGWSAALALTEVEDLDGVPALAVGAI